MKSLLHHFLIPHPTNNHRPKLLHLDTLVILLLVLLSVFLLKQPIQQAYPSVLGISANMSVQELVSLTNQERVSHGVAPLTLNEQLSEAARQKSVDVFAKNYWAHIAPDGTTPWYFIKNAGYEYLYAGENLARGFTTAPEVVDAWMASPSHRENMLSPKYTDIGFAIDSGSLVGSETVLVVQMFGTKYAQEGAPPTDTEAQVMDESSLTVVIPSQTPGEEAVASIKNEPLIDSRDATRSLAFFLFFLFIGVLIVDIIIIERKKIARVVSHNVDHILFLGILILAAILIGKGAIL